jgi:cyanophycin synthetase
VADALGYPVVVKPADLDGGRGVFACLRDEQAVRKAYAAARGLSQCILVEQYVPGQDYRLQVYRGNVFWTVLRRPAYVTGDGTTTVEALIHRTNLERKEPPPDPMIEQGVKPIMIDDELHDWLHYQGLTLTSVPAVGRQVRLHGAANVSAGGTREAILHKVHPDNLALAIHAARVLRLDLAGIDLLIPDIARSWKEGGAAICEVNSQPQLSAHLHRSLLPRMVPKQGRIPVIVLLGCFPDLGSLRHQVVAATRASGLRLGWVGMDAVAIGDEAWPLAFDGGAGGPGADTIDHAVAVARALLADPQIDALIWQVKTWPDTERGLPFDKVDGLIWLDDKASVAAPAPRANFSPRCWMIGASDGSDVQRLAAADLPRHLAALIGVPTHRLNEEEDDRI